MIRYAQLCPTSQPTHNQHCTRRRAIRTAGDGSWYGRQQDAGRGTSQAATADAPIRRAPGGGCARRARGQRDRMKASSYWAVRVIAAEVFDHLAPVLPPGARPARGQRNRPQDMQNPAHR